IRRQSKYRRTPIRLKYAVCMYDSTDSAAEQVPPNSDSAEIRSMQYACMIQPNQGQSNAERKVVTAGWSF
ncbi:MAG: hypothetical protein SGI94_14100, partial [Saprospiraceae bacterium]|nr:hypothetical protein [Saprospiraceae bacterium]